MIELAVNIFNLILYQPLLNALVFIYQYLPIRDFGLSIIVLTLLIRLIFYPLGAKAAIFQKAISEIQPKIQEIQKKYKDDKAKLAQATLELYQKEKVNPFSGCLPLLIQLPIIIALYRVFWRGFGPERLALLYSFVPNPGEINPFFLGAIDLTAANPFLAVFAGIAQFVQVKMVTFKKPKLKQKDGEVGFAQILQKQMVYALPIFTVFILLKLPSAIGLYWIVTSLFSIFQQYMVLRKPKIKNA